MSSDRDAETETGVFIPAGTKVTYVCHVVRAVRIRTADGIEHIVNPNVFPTLRT